MKICFMKSSQACDRYRSECRQIVANLKDCEVTIIPSEADVIVQFFCIQVDECLEEAALQLRYIENLKKPKAKVFVAGCAANVLGDEFLQFPEVDYVIQRKPVAKTILETLGYQNCENKYFLGDEEPLDMSLEISSGCQKKCGPCNFCFNGMAKIPVHSKPMDYLLTAVKTATNDGAKRITFTALNTCNYGIDFPDHKPMLHELIKKVSEIDKTKVIDVFSLTAANMYPELLQEIVTNPKVRLVELGIQSGSDHLLKLMNTGATIADIEKFLQAIVPYKNLKTIVIVGHPGETEEDFEETIKIIQKYNLWHIQVNTFLSIEGTKSSMMEQLPDEVIRERYEKISNILSEMKRKYLDNMIGKEVKAYILNAYTQKDNSVIVYMCEVASPVAFQYMCSKEEFNSKFGNKDEYDIISCIAKEVIDYDEESPIVSVSIIEE